MFLRVKPSKIGQKKKFVSTFYSAISHTSLGLFFTQYFMKISRAVLLRAARAIGGDVARYGTPFGSLDSVVPC